MALVGLNVVEVDGAGAPAIRGAATSVTGFLVLTERGLPNTPVRVHSYPQFVSRFGGYFSDGLGAYLVKGFFDNGGRTAYVNRVVASDATPASIVLQDGAPADTLALEGGYRGQVDPGGWADGLYVRIEHSSSAESRLRETAPAQIQSAAPLTDPTDMSALTTLSINVDGAVQATDLTFTAADFPGGPALATPAQIRDAINRQTTAVVASLAPMGELVLTSTGGVAATNQSSLNFTSLQVATAHADLGFAAMGTPAFGTPAALAATTAVVDRIDDFDVGDVLRIADGTENHVAKIVRITESSDTIEWAPAIPTPGNYDPLLTLFRNLEFDLTLASDGTEDEHVVETWTGLSMESDVANYALLMINDEVMGSRFVVATDENSGSGVGADLPAPLAFTRFQPGDDGTPTVNDFIGDQAQRTGLYAFDPIGIQLLCSERSDSSITSMALGYCGARGDCTFIGSVPDGYIDTDLSPARSYGQSFRGKKVYGALYGPYIKIFDPAGTGPNPVRFVPPSGHVAGVFSRIEATRGIHKAPAGDEANVVGALDVAYRLTDAEHDDLVRNASVNGLRVVPAGGVVVDASRTLSTDTRWLYVNVRLLFNYVKQSLLEGLTWVRQEPNRDQLWNTIKYSSVTPFLLGLWRQGAFGTGDPEDVFTVIVDETNNPPSEVDQGNLTVEVYFYPSRPAETIVIIVGQQPSGGSVTEGA